MDPITIAIFLVLGVGIMTTLTSCSNQKNSEKVDENGDISKFSEDDLEEEISSEEIVDSNWIVNGATVICTNAETVKSDSKVLKKTETNSVIAQKKDDLCQYDSKIAPLFKKCTALNEGICKYNCETEIWNDYDESKSLGNGKYGLLKEKAYLVCNIAGGLIFATDDGQLTGDCGKSIALSIISKWINGTENISDELLREAGILASQNEVSFFTALNYNFNPNFFSEGIKELKEIELDLTANKPYIVKDVNGNISVYPYYVGDGKITFGFGVTMDQDNLDPNKERTLLQMYQYYRIVYAPNVPFNDTRDSFVQIKGIPPIPVKELEQMFEYCITEVYQKGITDFFEIENGLTLTQNENDALVIMKYNMGFIPEKVRDAIVLSKKNNMSDSTARAYIRNEIYNYYSSLNNAQTYLAGWMNRTDATLDLYFK